MTLQIYLIITLIKTKNIKEYLKNKNFILN